MTTLSDEVLWYLDSRGIAVPEEWQEPLIRTPEPSYVPGARFNPERVDRVLRAFKALRHTQGRLAGSPLILDSWQVAYIIAPVFGWEHLNEDDEWVRIISEVWIEVSRKNGKSTLCGGVGIYLLAADGEPGAQIVTAATTRDQAGYVFAPIAMLAESNPMLKRSFKSMRASHKLIHRKSGSYMQAISSVGDAIHGANIHGAIVDEVHLHKTPELIEAIETGTGSRRQPLCVFITTADDGKPLSVYARKRRKVENLADRVLEDPTIYGVIWAAARYERELKDPFSEETLRRANPGYGVSPTASYLAKKAKQARDNPAEYANFLRLHLGVRTKQVTRFIGLDEWDATAGMVDEEALRGRECFVGLDLGSTSDVTAASYTFPDRETDTYTTIWRMWIPEDSFPSLNKRTDGGADVWRREGWLNVTPGNVIDNRAIVDQILADSQKFQIITAGHDRWGAADVARRLNDEGIETTGLGQGFATLSSPMKEMLRLVKVGRYIHGGNPIMRWMIDNLVVAVDPAGNVKPDKASAFDKIDGVSAAAMSLSEAITQEGDGDILRDLYGTD